MSGTVTTQIATPTASDTSPKNIELTSSDPNAIKIFQPVMKDPTDQLVYTLEQIEAAKSLGPSADNYVGAFSHDTDQFFVDTGNANVKQIESLSSVFSTAPEAPSEGMGDVLILVLALGIVYYYLKGKI